MPGPVFVGTQITGFVTFSNAAAGAGVATAADVLDFEFDVGGGIFVLNPSNGQTVNPGTNLMLLGAAGVTGSFLLDLPDLAGPGITGLLTDDGSMWEISIPDFGGAVVNGGVSQWSQVPEPAAACLLMVGLAGVTIGRRKSWTR